MFECVRNYTISYDMSHRMNLQPYKTKPQKVREYPYGEQLGYSSKYFESSLSQPPGVVLTGVSIGPSPQLPPCVYTSNARISPASSPHVPTRTKAGTSASLSSTSANCNVTPSEELPEDELYDGYLQTILNDYGLQLSPGGSRVEEVEQSLSESEFKDELEPRQSPIDFTKADVKSPIGEASNSSTESASATTYPGSKFRKITECQKSATHSSQSKEEETPQADSLPPIPELQPIDESEPVAGPSSKKKRKIGLYMCGPFDDPEKEKKRLNAVNAFRNREKNKQLTQELKAKNNKLELVNVQCSKALKRITSEAMKLQQDIDDKAKERNLLETELRRKESEVREQREKLALFRGHLDLIASSLDEDNPARKLISTLLNKLPYEGQR